MKHRFILATLVFCAANLFAHAQKSVPVLRPGDLVAVCGDSITEQKLYSLYNKTLAALHDAARPKPSGKFVFNKLKHTYAGI
ncbi:MAG: hypothetical protein LBM04_09950 [Opitutaceae bacterium]|nr:hypothetical protein [Opitutaceae bacterium]